MVKDKSVIAIIPARSDSKGLPGKNIRNLHGKPLIAWTIEAAAMCPLIDYVLVSTDSIEIAEIANRFGAATPFIRPKYLALDNTPTNSVISHALDYCKENLNLEFEYVVVLEPTSPLRGSDDIDRAFEQLLKHETATSIVGISRTETQNPAFLFNLETDGCLKGLSESFHATRRQDVDDVFFLEGSIYLTSCEEFRRNNGFYHAKTIGCLFPKWKSFEIDDLTDFIIVEALLTRKEELDELS
jgi:CMP-N,N'-diacetyllegionaminic acid synthase